MADRKKSGGNICCAALCRNASNLQSCRNKSFFRFPEEYDRCRQWVESTRRDDLLGLSPAVVRSRGFTLCSDHFEDTQFGTATDGERCRLLWNAVPTLFTAPAPPIQPGQRNRLRWAASKRDRSHRSAGSPGSGATLVKKKVTSYLILDSDEDFSDVEICEEPPPPPSGDRGQKRPERGEGGSSVQPQTDDGQQASSQPTASSLRMEVDEVVDHRDGDDDDDHHHHASVPDMDDPQVSQQQASKQTSGVMELEVNEVVEDISMGVDREDNDDDDDDDDDDDNGNDDGNDDDEDYVCDDDDDDDDDDIDDDDDDDEHPDESVLNKDDTQVSQQQSSKQTSGVFELEVDEVVNEGVIAGSADVDLENIDDDEYDDENVHHVESVLNKDDTQVSQQQGSKQTSGVLELEVDEVVDEGVHGESADVDLENIDDDEYDDENVQDGEAAQDTQQVSQQSSGVVELEEDEMIDIVSSDEDHEDERMQYINDTQASQPVTKQTSEKILYSFGGQKRKNTTPLNHSSLDEVLAKHPKTSPAIAVVPMLLTKSIQNRGLYVTSALSEIQKQPDQLLRTLSATTTVRPLGLTSAIQDDPGKQLNRDAEARALHDGDRGFQFVADSPELSTAIHDPEFLRQLQASRPSVDVVATILTAQNACFQNCGMCNIYKYNSLSMPCVFWGKQPVTCTLTEEGIAMVTTRELTRLDLLHYQVSQHPLMEREKFSAVWSLIRLRHKSLLAVSLVYVLCIIKEVYTRGGFSRTSESRLVKSLSVPFVFVGRNHKSHVDSYIGLEDEGGVQGFSAFFKAKDTLATMPPQRQHIQVKSENSKNADSGDDLQIVELGSGVGIDSVSGVGSDGTSNCAGGQMWTSSPQGPEIDAITVIPLSESTSPPSLGDVSEEAESNPLIDGHSMTYPSPLPAVESTLLDAKEEPSVFFEPLMGSAHQDTPNTHQHFPSNVTGESERQEMSGTNRNLQSEPPRGLASHEAVATNRGLLSTAPGREAEVIQSEGGEQIVTVEGSRDCYAASSGTVVSQLQSSCFTEKVKVEEMEPECWTEVTPSGTEVSQPQSCCSTEEVHVEERVYESVMTLSGTETSLTQTCCSAEEVKLEAKERECDTTVTLSGTEASLAQTCRSSEEIQVHEREHHTAMTLSGTEANLTQTCRSSEEIQVQGREHHTPMTLSGTEVTQPQSCCSQDVKVEERERESALTLFGFLDDRIWAESAENREIHKSSEDQTDPDELYGIAEINKGHKKATIGRPVSNTQSTASFPEASTMDASNALSLLHPYMAYVQPKGYLKAITEADLPPATTEAVSPPAITPTAITPPATTKAVISPAATEATSSAPRDEWSSACPCGPRKSGVFPSFSFLQCTYSANQFTILKDMGQAIVGGRLIFCFYSGQEVFFSLLHLKRCRMLDAGSAPPHWLLAAALDCPTLTSEEVELVLGDSGNHVSAVRNSTANRLLIHGSALARLLHGGKGGLEEEAVTKIQVHHVGHICPHSSSAIGRIQSEDGAMKLVQHAWMRAFRWHQDFTQSAKRDAPATTGRAADGKGSSSESCRRKAVLCVRRCPMSHHDTESHEFFSLSTVAWVTGAIKQEPEPDALRCSAGGGTQTSTSEPPHTGKKQPDTGVRLTNLGENQPVSKVKELQQNVTLKRPGAGGNTDEDGHRRFWDDRFNSSPQFSVVDVQTTEGNSVPEFRLNGVRPISSDTDAAAKLRAEAALDGVVLEGSCGRVRSLLTEEEVTELMEEEGEEKLSVGDYHLVLTGTLTAGGRRYVCLSIGGLVMVNWREVVEELDRMDDRRMLFLQARRLHAFLYQPPAFVNLSLGRRFSSVNHAATLSSAPYVAVNTLVAIYHMGSGMLEREKMLVRFVDLDPAALSLPGFLLIRKEEGRSET